MSSQEDNFTVSEEVKQLVSAIVAKNNLKTTCEIKYYSGSQAGDGYSTKPVAVDITDAEVSISLFLKCAVRVDGYTPDAYSVYAIETYFYKTIYPAYNEFLQSKGVTDGFRNVPICYDYNETIGSEILALENLRKRGFTLFDRFTCMNDEHLKLTLRVFAKFHAISFALKDQRKELHDKFCERCPNFFEKYDVMHKMVTNMTKAFIEKLDAMKDKDLFDRCDKLDTKVYDRFRNLSKYLTDYAIFTKGDCWVNNMMILYENDDREHPKDVMLVDWQCVSRGSPIHDIGGLFYCVASMGAIDSYKHYLQIYHEELSKSIEQLGSDPEVLYPRSVFEKEWIDHGVFALGLCLMGIKVMLSESKDASGVESNSTEDDVANMFMNVSHDEEEYLRRTKYVVRHMIDIGVL